MKIKRFILLVFFFFTYNFSFAQLKIGPVIGLNISGWSPDNFYDPSHFGLSSTVEFENKISFHAGGLLDYSINKYVGLQCSLILSMEGSKSEENDVVGIFNSDTNYANISATNNLTYLLLPIDFKIGMEIGKEDKLYGLVGLYIGYLISGTSNSHKVIIDHYAGQTITTDYGNATTDITAYTLKTDIGMRLGTGIAINSGLTLNAYYLIGLNALNKYRNLNYFSQEKNRVIMISLGWLWGKKADPEIKN